MLPGDALVHMVAIAEAYDYIAKGGVDGYIVKTTKAMYRYLRPLKIAHGPISWDGVNEDTGRFQPDLWDECQQEVRAWVVEAASIYDPYKGTKFSTWCMVHIKLRLLACLSRAKKEAGLRKVFKKQAPHEIYAAAAGREPSELLDVRGKLTDEDRALWDRIQEAQKKWERSLNTGRVKDRWQKDPAKMIARKTGIDYKRVKRLFKSIKDMEMPEIHTETSHWRNGQKVRGKVFA